MTASPMEIEPAPTGARMLDRYELLAEIASGGMGVVLLARLAGAGGFQRLFAIKVLHPHLVDDPEFVTMLLEEARLAAKIHHPNVVATVDVGQQRAAHFIVMDYVEGFPLTRILDAGPFNRRERIRIVHRMLIDALAGLEAAHELTDDDGAPLGIVHRDVSPDNILVGVDGVGRVTDFGVAFAPSGAEGASVEPIKGKPEYIAPEQAGGGVVDRRADIWALGVILWEALTGNRLFYAETEEAMLLKVVSEPIVSPAVFFPQIPPELEALCMQALDRDPKRRPSSAREFAFELERATAPYGLLADAHEVADILRDRFGVELDARRKVIQYYSSRAPVEWSADSEEAPVKSGQRSHWDGFLALPRLADAASWVLPESSPRPPLVNLESPPSSRQRSTPAGTTAESLPPKSRALTGVFALLALFGLGSLTTFGLLRFRALNEITPALWTATPVVSTAGAARSDHAAPAVPTPDPEAPLAETPDPETPDSDAPVAEAPVATAVPGASADEPVARLVAPMPAAVDATAIPVPPKPRARPGNAWNAKAKRERATSDSSETTQPSRAPAQEAAPGRAQPSSDVPALTVEQNPYRLQ